MSDKKEKDQGQTRRGPWSPEEDRRLIEIIAMYGPTNWVRISCLLGSRSPKQCRERYHQNLKPLLNRNPITFEEGLLIEQLVAKHGKKWAEIARHLSGRLDNAIKNWWNGGANRRRRALQIVPPASPHYRSPEARLRQNLATGARANVPHGISNQHTLANATGPNGPISQHALSHPAQTAQVAHPPAQTAPLAHALHYPKVPHFPQILFNTSMFGSMESAPPAPYAAARPPVRLASMDHAPLPHLAELKWHHEDRRHSVTAAPLSLTLPALYTHTNSLDHYGSPGSLASRSNSVCTDLHPLSLTPTLSSATLRRPSVAPDLFPNPMGMTPSLGLVSHNLARTHSSRSSQSSQKSLMSQVQQDQNGHTESPSHISQKLNADTIPSFQNLSKSIVHDKATERMKVSSLID